MGLTHVVCEREHSTYDKIYCYTLVNKTYMKSKSTEPKLLSVQKRIQVVSFLFVLLVTAGLVFAVVRPFLQVLVLGFILAVLFRPVFHHFHKHMQARGLAALATIASILLLALVPLALISLLVFNEAVGFYDSFSRGEVVFDQTQLIASLPAHLQSFVVTGLQDLSTFASKLSANALQTFGSLLSNVATFALSFFLTLFTTYYMLKDGHVFEQALIDISPIEDAQEQILFTKVATAVTGVVKGSFLTALIQGIVATIGFLIFGLENPFLWGVCTAIAALVPTVGTSLVLIPAVVYLFIIGHTPQAIGLLVWGAFAVGLIDNIVGPRMLGRATQVHPLLMLLAVLGGVSVFGFLGVLLGPIIMAVFVAMVEMYRTEFQEFLNR